MSTGNRVAIVAGIVGSGGLMPPQLTAEDMPSLILPTRSRREVTPRQERRLAAKRARKAAKRAAQAQAQQEGGDSNA